MSEFSPEYKEYVNPDNSHLQNFCKYLYNDFKGFVIKENGLKGGKGVFVSGDHFKTLEEGIKLANKLRKQNNPFIIEQKINW